MDGMDVTPFAKMAEGNKVCEMAMALLEVRFRVSHLHECYGEKNETKVQWWYLFTSINTSSTAPASSEQRDPSPC
jgi:hypothetical protein